MTHGVGTRQLAQPSSVSEVTRSLPESPSHATFRAEDANGTFRNEAISAGTWPASPSVVRAPSRTTSEGERPSSRVKTRAVTRVSDPASAGSQTRLTWSGAEGERLGEDRGRRWGTHRSD